MIDPGHGGKDPGAHGLHGLVEKDVNLRFAKILGEELRQKGFKVLYTRTTDVFIPLETRTELANSKGADLFISVHCNAHSDAETSGLETYSLNLANNRDAVRVAARENASSSKKISDLQAILTDLMLSAKTTESRDLAQYVQKRALADMEAYEPTARDAAILAAILRSVPDADTVAVVSQNTLNWGALAERHHYASFPLGVFTPVPVRDLTETTWKDFWTFIRTGKTDSLPVRSWQAQYVLLDLTRPWCVRDRQCPVPATGGPQQPVARDFNALVLQARQEMDTVYDQGGFVILRRRPEPTPAAAKTAPPPVAPDQPAETPAGNVTPWRSGLLQSETLWPPETSPAVPCSVPFSGHPDERRALILSTR